MAIHNRSDRKDAEQCLFTVHFAFCGAPVMKNAKITKEYCWHCILSIQYGDRDVIKEKGRLLAY